jgi:hypothetical protein
MKFLINEDNELEILLEDFRQHILSLDQDETLQLKDLLKDYKKKEIKISDAVRIDPQTITYGGCIDGIS